MAVVADNEIERSAARGDERRLEGKNLADSEDQQNSAIRALSGGRTMRAVAPDGGARSLPGFPNPSSSILRWPAFRAPPPSVRSNDLPYPGRAARVPCPGTGFERPRNRGRPSRSSAKIAPDRRNGVEKHRGRQTGERSRKHWIAPVPWGGANGAVARKPVVRKRSHTYGVDDTAWWPGSCGEHPVVAASAPPSLLLHHLP